jgi:hypothetical protein
MKTHKQKILQVTYKGETRYFEESPSGSIFPYGGGFQTIIPAGAEVKEVDSLPNESMWGYCSIDGGPKFKCKCNPLARWNGWAMPQILASEIPAFIAYINGDGDNFVHAKLEGDELVLHNDDTLSGHYEATRIPCNDGLYDFSWAGWCFDFEAFDFSTLFETTK